MRLLIHLTLSHKLIIWWKLIFLYQLSVCFDEIVCINDFYLCWIFAEKLFYISTQIVWEGVRGPEEFRVKKSGHVTKHQTKFPKAPARLILNISSYLFISFHKMMRDLQVAITNLLIMEVGRGSWCLRLFDFSPSGNSSFNVGLPPHSIMLAQAPLSLSLSFTRPTTFNILNLIATCTVGYCDIILSDYYKCLIKNFNFEKLAGWLV